MNTRSTEFDLSNASDPCVVCGKAINPRKLYCSETCRKEAAKLRKNIRSLFARVSPLGFNIEFTLGTIPNMRIPLYLRRFYPNAQDTFLLSYSELVGRDIAYAGDMWENFKWSVGKYVFDFISTENQLKTEDAYEFRKRMEQHCDLGLILHGPNFICTSCHGKYLKSGLSQTDYCPECNSCNFDKIPF